MPFDDHDRAAAEAGRASAVAKAQPSAAAKRKAASKLTDDDMPVHSFRSLLADLATLTRNTVRLGRDHTTEILATPTGIQRRAFDLLALSSPHRSQPPTKQPGKYNHLREIMGKVPLKEAGERCPHPVRIAARFVLSSPCTSRSAARHRDAVSMQCSAWPIAPLHACAAGEWSDCQSVDGGSAPR